MPPLVPPRLLARLPLEIQQQILSALNQGRKKPGGNRPDTDSCPVRPDRPLDLSGSAAAQLEFDD
jgi:hypothetical protein